MGTPGVTAGTAPLAPRAIGRSAGPSAVDIPTTVYTLFMFAAILDTGGALGVKYGAFLLVTLYLGVTALTGTVAVPLSVLVIEGLLFGVAPAFFLFLAVTAYGVAPSTAVGRLTPFITWLLYPVLVKVDSRERLVSVFSQAVLFGSVLILVMFGVLIGLYVLDRVDSIVVINAFTDSHRLGYFGVKPLDTGTAFFFPGVYFRWSLLLIPAAIIAFARGRVRFFTTVGAILASASAAALAALVLGVGCVLLDHRLSRPLRRRYARRAFVLAIGLGVLGVALYRAGFGSVVELIVGKLSSASTNMKIGHIQSIVDESTQSIGRLLFGMGVGSSFYSVGAGDFVSDVEVSHFELVRQFGLVYALAFFTYVGWLTAAVWRTDGDGRLLGIGLMLLFIAAGTNPLLLTSVFFILLVLCRAYLTIAAKPQRGVQLPVSAPANYR
jgi:hypothetical protein